MAAEVIDRLFILRIRTSGFRVILCLESPYMFAASRGNIWDLNEGTGKRLFELHPPTIWISTQSLWQAVEQKSC